MKRENDPQIPSLPEALSATCSSHPAKVMPRRKKKKMAGGALTLCQRQYKENHGSCGAEAPALVRETRVQALATTQQRCIIT